MSKQWCGQTGALIGAEVRKHSQQILPASRESFNENKVTNYFFKNIFYGKFK